MNTMTLYLEQELASCFVSNLQNASGYEALIWVNVDRIESRLGLLKYLLCREAKSKKRFLCQHYLWCSRTSSLWCISFLVAIEPLIGENLWHPDLFYSVNIEYPPLTWHGRTPSHQKSKCMMSFHWLVQTLSWNSINTATKLISIM